MRNILSSVCLGALVLGILASTPSGARAQGCGRVVYAAPAYGYYYAPMYYSAPRASAYYYVPATGQYYYYYPAPVGTAAASSPAPTDRVAQTGSATTERYFYPPRYSDANPVGAVNLRPGPDAVKRAWQPGDPNPILTHTFE